MSQDIVKSYDFGNLPPFIIATILSQVKIAEYRNATLVCKSWYYASADPRVAKNIRFTFGHDATTCNYLVRPIHNACFNGCNWDKLHYREILKNFGSTITDIQIYANITPTRLFEMFLYLPNVRSLRISDGSKYVSPKNFLQSNCYTKSKDVVLRNLAQIKKIDVWTEVRNLKLYRLFLSYCINVDELIWAHDKKDCGDFLYNYLLDPAENPVLYKIVELQLYNVDSDNCSKFFEKMIQLELTQLKRLAISKIPTNYYDSTFKEFCKTYTFLERLTITGCNERHLANICQYMTNLKSLTLNNCTANNLSQLLHLRQLKVLSIDRIDIVVNDDILLWLSVGNKLLKKLHINKVDANMLEVICENNKNLEELTIKELETQDCESVFRNLVKLKELWLWFTEPPKQHSSEIQSNHRYNITNLTKLELISISCYVPGITPELIRRMPKLRHGCDYIWDPTDEDLARAMIEDLSALAVHSNNLGIEEKVNIIYDISDFNWCRQLLL